MLRAMNVAPDRLIQSRSARGLSRIHSVLVVPMAETVGSLLVELRST
jgi:hypothetical protein